MFSAIFCFVVCAVGEQQKPSVTKIETNTLVVTHDPNPRRIILTVFIPIPREVTLPTSLLNVTLYMLHEENERRMKAMIKYAQMQVLAAEQRANECKERAEKAEKKLTELDYMHSLLQHKPTPTASASCNVTRY